MKTTLSTVAFLFLLLAANAQDRREYIDAYKDIAIREMGRTGIPASIKLAQAILESGAGGSHLAQKANNHFGIKCGNDWRGKKYMQKDDDTNKHGKLVKSCFREFGSAEESFIAHSEFLADPLKNNRYGFLFDYDPTDYKAWAHGLKKAGYATNPNYPKLLIKIIEDYDLHSYDIYLQEEGILADRKKGKRAEESKNDNWMISPDEAVDMSNFADKRSERYNNDVRFVFAREGDRVSDIAQATETASWRIIRYNESINDELQMLEEGQRVYLQRKRKKFRGKQQFHITKEGEDMVDIAQTYAIQLDDLYKRNQMSSGSEAAKGQKIYLRGKRDDAPKLRTRDMASATKTERPSAAPEPEKKETTVSTQVPQPDYTASTITGTPPVTETNRNESESFLKKADLIQADYTVQKGDTLYQIARLHGVTLNDLKKMNNLEGDTIHPGQKIRLSQ